MSAHDDETAAPVSPHELAHERIDTRVGRLEALVHDVVADQVRVPRSRGVFTCSSCGTSEEREIVASPTSFAEVLYAFREELRSMVLYDRPVHTPPQPIAHPDIERQVLGAALLGLSHPAFAQLRREHFYCAFYGRLWEIVREAGPDLAALSVPLPSRADDEQAAIAAAEKARILRASLLASRFEARGWGRAENAISEILGLLGPRQAVTVTPLAVDAILDAAWRRKLVLDLQLLIAEIKTTVGTDVGAAPMNDDHVRAALLQALATVDAGPAGEIVQRELDRQAASKDPAAHERARLYSWQRDLVYRAAGITGWLTRGIGVRTVGSARDRVERLIARLDEARAQLVDLLAHLDTTA